MKLLLRLLLPALIVTALLYAIGTLAHAAQDPARPFPNHEEPPPGWSCMRQDVNGSVEEAHACGCQRMCSKDADGNETVIEDPTCKVFCHKDHCTCEVTKCSTN